MRKIKRTNTEILEQLNRAWDSEEHGTRFRTMTYEQGVRYTIDWLFGDEEDPPIPNE